jgi:hypothetical protein
VGVAAPDGEIVTLRILDPQGSEIALVEGVAKGGYAEHIVHLQDVQLWSPASPALYTAVAEVGGDRLETRFGMRWVSYENGLIHLNGEPLYVRGALDQAFYPETVYRAPSEAAIETEIRVAKEMGLNLLRKHIKLEDPRYLDACDRLGMLIWEEPACFYKYTPQAKERFRAEIEAMIHRDYNHPSIIAWSLYNEEWGLEWRLWRDVEKQQHVEELYHHAKRLDPTRLFCDNSGWAHVKTDLNDWHRYFTAPDLIAEWKQDLAVCVEQPERNFVEGKQANAAGVPVLVSEFGVWGLPEVSRITDFYQGRPWWFDAQWAGHTEEFKYPATAERHFARYGLDQVFGTLDDLARATQRRMMRALKPIIEEMRKRPALAGYVVTEFTDIEWESNGWLDYFRRPKAGYREFRWFNAPVVVGVELPRHNFWENETLSAHFWCSNHTREHHVGVLRWQVPGFQWLRGEIEVEIPPFYSGPLPCEPLTLTVPAVTGATRAGLDLELIVEDGILARNSEELTFTSRAALEAPRGHGGAEAGPVALFGEARLLEGGLSDAGFAVTHELKPGVLAITSTLSAEVRAHLARGGKALLIAEHGENTPEKGLLSFRRLPRGESWDRAASMLYARPGLFGDLPVGGMLGWEMEALFPHHVVPLSNYLQDFGGRGIELPSNQANVDPAGVLGGYFEGWVGKFAATLLRMPYEEGELVVTTWRLLEHYESQPIGTVLLHRLVALAAAPAAAVVG